VIDALIREKPLASPARKICCEKNIERVKTKSGTMARALKRIHVEKCH
jgi:hypothetical protein